MCHKLQLFSDSIYYFIVAIFSYSHWGTYMVRTLSHLRKLCSMLAINFNIEFLRSWAIAENQSVGWKNKGIYDQGRRLREQWIGSRQALWDICGVYFISLKCERYTNNRFPRTVFPSVTHFAVMFHCYSSKVSVLSGYISLSDSHVREGGMTSKVFSSC
jgi:hypothetical protein